VNLRLQRAFFVLGLILGLSTGALGIEQSPQRSRQLNKRRTRLHRVKWNPVFRPSRDSLLRQNEEIDRLALPRIHDDAQLRELVASGDLVPIEESQTLHIERRLDPSRRYCRPWTRAFLEDLSEAYYQQFHSPIQVNSAVRTVVMQRKLRRHNRNAAPESGETASSHLAGITVDIQRRGMTRPQVQWVEQYMLPLQKQGLVEPEEERRQWVFHVAVSGRYADWHQAKSLAGEPPSPLSRPGQVEFLPQRVSDIRSFDQ
jgi:hypothetical protein